MYRHQSPATEQHTFWHYPFQMAKINDATPFSTPEQTRYLFSKTRKAAVCLLRRWGRGKCHEWERQLSLDLLAKVSATKRIGRVWLHNAEQFDEETASIKGANDTSALIDVVAISRSSFSGLRHSRGIKPWLKKDEINILWVKWEQGIAYRVASGYVYEEDWKCLDLEEINLVLG